MNFPNVQVLSANSTSQFFGDQVRWKSVLEISIEGSFIDLNSNNHSAIHTLTNNFETSAFAGSTFYSNITINGINFGDGYVNNFTASADNVDVKNKKYTASIIIPIEGNLNTISTDNLGSVSKLNFEFIDSFSENSVFTKGEGAKDTYNQTVSLSISPKIKTDGKSFAETIIKSFLNNNQLTSLISGVYQKTNIKKYYEQSYDEINNSYTCNSNFELYTRLVDSEEATLVNRSVRVEYNNDGTINITESGEVIGNNIGNDNVRYQNAITKVKTLKNGAFGRLSSYVPSSGINNNPLINQIISENISTIPFEGRVTYSITFTNSKEVIAQSGYWNFTIGVGINEGGETILTEDGTIIGTGDVTLNKSKFNRARNLFNIKKSEIQSRLQNYYSGNGTIKELSSSVIYNDIEGSVQYSTSYTDSDSLVNNQIVRKAVSTVTQDYNRNLFSTFNIIGKKEIAQIQQNLLQNNTTVNIKLNGRFQESYKQYFNFAKNIADQYKSNKHILSASYTYSPTNREFNLNVTYFNMPN
jgi:hypothetical protein